MTDTELALLERIASALERIDGHLGNMKPAGTLIELRALASAASHLEKHFDVIAGAVVRMEQSRKEGKR